MKNLKIEIQSLLNIYKTGNFHEAESLNKKMIQENPNEIFLHNFLGITLMAQDKLEDAIKCYENAIKIKSDYAPIYDNLGTIFKIRENYKKAEFNYKKAIKLNNSSAETYNNLGNLFFSQNKNESAISYYKKATKINSRFFVAYYNLGVTFKNIGKINDAKLNLQKTIGINPNFYPAHRILSQITKYKKNNPHFESLMKSYENIKIPKKNKTELFFAIGKAYEDLKDYKKSFDFFKEGNYLRRQNVNFILKKEINEFHILKKIFNQNLISRFKNKGHRDSTPIFILGMPRSGTTLVEQIISSHSDVYGGDELEFLPKVIQNNISSEIDVSFIKKINNFSNQDFTKIGRDYIREIKKISSKSKKITDKLPINFKWIGLISVILPKSIIIHCTRNPKDVCFSIFKNYFTNKKLNFAYDLKEIVSFYKIYVDLINYWKKVLPNKIYDLSYEKLIKNPNVQIKKLIKTCDLKWEKSCIEFYKNKRPIKTNSNTQAREKLYKTSVHSWKNYEKYLSEYYNDLNN